MRATMTSPSAKKLTLIIALISLSACASTPAITARSVTPDKEQMLAARQEEASSFPLSESENGIKGRIVLLGPSLRIVDQDERVLKSFRISGRDRRLSRVVGNWSGGPIYFISGDESIGFGSYNGIMTQLFQVMDGHLHWVMAENSSGKEQVHLMKSLKTHWRAEISSNQSTLDVFKVACRPDFEKSTDSDPKFTVSYIRYHFDGKSWQTLAKTEEGFWEHEDDSNFPGKQLFP